MIFTTLFSQHIVLVAALDCHITMNKHISVAAKTYNFERRRLISIRGFRTSTAPASLVHDFALSRIDYSSSQQFASTHDVTTTFNGYRTMQLE